MSMKVQVFGLNCLEVLARVVAPVLARFVAPVPSPRVLALAHPHHRNDRQASGWNATTGLNRASRPVHTEA
jgi:hypothetical protein